MENLHSKRRIKWRLIQFLLVIVIQNGAHGISCPSSCICVFDDILENNNAKCSFGNSSTEISWLRNDVYTIIALACTDAVENFKYDCKDFPQFNISSNDAWLAVTGCAPSILRCAQNMFMPESTIVQIDVKMISGTNRADDLTHFSRVDQARIHLRDEDTVLPAITKSLSALKSLIINGGNLQLSSKMFSQINLEYLRLSLNNIQELPPNTFDGLRNLKLLAIEGSFFENLNANALKGLDSLNELIIENNTLIAIDMHAFSSIKQLNKLYITNNRLKLIPNGLFTDLDQLREVHIILNQVGMTLDTHAFANLSPSIKVVNILDSKLKNLPENVFNNTNSIIELYFNRNQIESVSPKLFASMTRLKELNLSENRIQNIPDELFSETKDLENLDLGYNYISILKGNIFKHNSKLKKVNLNNNRITNMDRDIFKGTNLRKLNLSSNKLKRIIGSNITEWQVKQLNLSHNELGVFEDWFRDLVGLEYLDLSGNKIKLIKESHIFGNNTKITIDLRGNRVAGVVRDTPDAIVSVTPGDIKLYLSDNPLQCDCVTTALLKEWNEYQILADYEDITCDNGEKLKVLNLLTLCNNTE